jgi:hypothetical protein
LCLRNKRKRETVEGIARLFNVPPQAMIPANKGNAHELGGEWLYTTTVTTSGPAPTLDEMTAFIRQSIDLLNNPLLGGAHPESIGMITDRSLLARRLIAAEEAQDYELCAAIKKRLDELNTQE